MLLLCWNSVPGDLRPGVAFQLQNTCSRDVVPDFFAIILMASIGIKKARRLFGGMATGKGKMRPASSDIAEQTLWEAGIAQCHG
ncbi:hypothetical protein TH5_06735 [Thalassospira xianhensis MCCC 1A02616]|uniref:Uncharacterized protein n=1 Tax=Thalassospira xianhensis MCCC 1A02616 TaxID=1177929 RepID=A0A367UEU3_9PROT|nr:hypothetical protein TH5_06735 [Thalassospira xianhensis MCCC 1A02616]